MTRSYWLGLFNNFSVLSDSSFVIAESLPLFLFLFCHFGDLFGSSDSTINKWIRSADAICSTAGQWLHITCGELLSDSLDWLDHISHILLTDLLGWKMISHVRHHSGRNYFLFYYSTAAALEVLVSH